jgi:hypothetical protein
MGRVHAEVIGQQVRPGLVPALLQLQKDCPAEAIRVTSEEKSGSAKART